MRLKLWWAALLLAGPALASPTQPVAWQAEVLPTTARPGEIVTLIFNATVDPGWHIYGLKPLDGPVATGFTLAADSDLELAGEFLEPPPATKYDEAFGIEVSYHSGQVELRQGLSVPTDAKPGRLTARGVVRYQACNDRSCLPPTDYAVDLPLTIEAGPVRVGHSTLPTMGEGSPIEQGSPVPEAQRGTVRPAASAPQASLANQAGTAEAARQRGLGAFLLVAFLAGLAALLTPCVFPMVPITVSFFTKQAADRPGRRVSLALFYGLGIVVMYTGLGLLLAVTMGATGAQKVAANPWVNLGFAGLFIFFALSLFGYFELALPSGLVNRSSALGSAGGYFGAAFMGLTLTLAAFTCTVQFVGGVLVWAANGEWLWPILGMLSFSLAFASPFVLLALFPQWLASLPRSGGWLHDTKVVLAFIELGAAFKFISNADLVWDWHIFSRDLVLGLWATIALLTAIYLYGRLSIAGTAAPEKLTRARAGSGTLFAALALWLAWGLSGARLESNLESLLPPVGYGRGAAQASEWLTDLDQGLAQARSRGQLALVDFTGVTCTNCRWMEQNLFVLPEIRGRLAKLTLVKLYTDQGPRAEEYRRLQTERYGTISLPFYALLRPDGSTVTTFDGMTRDPATFAAFLDSAAGG